MKRISRFICLFLFVVVAIGDLHTAQTQTISPAEIAKLQERALKRVEEQGVIQQIEERIPGLIEDVKQKTFEKKVDEITPLASVPYIPQSIAKKLLPGGLKLKGYKEEFDLPGTRLAVYRQDIRNLGLDAVAFGLNFFTHKLLFQARVDKTLGSIKADPQAFYKLIRGIQKVEQKRSIRKALMAIPPAYLATWAFKRFYQGDEQQYKDLRFYIKRNQSLRGMNMFSQPAQFALLVHFLTSQLVAVLENQKIPVTDQLAKNAYDALWVAGGEYMEFKQEELKAAFMYEKKHGSLKGFVSEGKTPKFDYLIKKTGKKFPVQVPVVPILSALVYPETSILKFVYFVVRSYFKIVSYVLGVDVKELAGPMLEMPGELVRQQVEVKAERSKIAAFGLATYDRLKQLGVFSFAKRLIVFYFTFQAMNAIRDNLWFDYLVRNKKLAMKVMRNYRDALQGRAGAKTLVDAENQLREFVEQGQQITANTLLTFVTGKSFFSWAHVLRRKAAFTSLKLTLGVAALPVAAMGVLMLVNIARKKNN